MYSGLFSSQILDGHADQFLWTTFIAPFHWVLWLTIISLSFWSSITIWIIFRYPKGSTEFNFLETLAISFSSIFGLTTYNVANVGTNSSARLSLFVIYICGSLFYYIYISSLTSKLAIPAGYKPFQSPEELLETSYRY